MDVNSYLIRKQALAAAQRAFCVSQRVEQNNFAPPVDSGHDASYDASNQTIISFLTSTRHEENAVGAGPQMENRVG